MDQAEEGPFVEGSSLELDREEDLVVVRWDLYLAGLCYEVCLVRVEDT